jgi:hypothetical protein
MMLVSVTIPTFLNDYHLKQVLVDNLAIWNTPVVARIIEIPTNVTLSSLSLILLKTLLEIYR